MKQIFVFFILVACSSCELHKQEAFLKGTETKSVFELKTIEKMFSAVASDDYFGLEELIKSQNLDLNIQNEQGQLLLNEALKLENDLITTLLLKYGADPDRLDKNEVSGREIIKTLPQFDTWEKILNGEAPDQYFLNEKIVELVSETAEDTQDTAIKKLGLYFFAGADVNAKNIREYTLLIIASSKGLTSLVTFLCDTDGVDINAKAGRYTALSLTRKLARRNPKLNEVIEILLKHGAEQ